MGRLTESLLDFIAAMPDRPLPASMIALARTGFTDAVGVMAAGVHEPVVARLMAYVGSQGGSAEARLLLGSQRARASDAALVGATAAQVLDYDDYAYHNHPSAVLVPAILAEAEATGAGGEAMVRAYITGYEVWAVVMKREPDHLHSKGWHPTAVFGAIGAAAALAVLRRLPRAVARDAMGLAVAYGGGVLANFGAMAKSFQGGKAAQTGVAAVRMALAGVDAGAGAIDGEQGLLAALSPAGRVDRESPAADLGEHWYGAAHGLNIKRYPMVGASQRVIDATLQCRRQNAIEPAAVTRICVHISRKHAAVMPFHRPQTALEAKFSLEFAAAAALLAGRVGLAELHDDFVRRDAVQAMMRKVVLEIGPDDDPVYPVGARADWVEIGDRQGNTYVSEKVERALGHGLNPMTAQQLREKFISCVCAGGHSEATAERLYRQLQNLQTLESAAALSLTD